MTALLHQPIVLVLNRHWQAIYVKTPADAFCMMATGAAAGLDIGRAATDADARDDLEIAAAPQYIVPARWSEWLKLPVRDYDRAIRTPKGPVRVPTVIVSARYAKVPLRRLAFGARGLWERDGGVCQYTGRKLRPGEGNIDHIVPRSRGGATSWENCVLAHHEVNSAKADRLPAEAGLRLRRTPVAPKALPATLLIRNSHNVPDWRHFLLEEQACGAQGS